MVPAARKGKVEVSDLPLPADQQAEACYEELNTNWEVAVQEAKKGGKEPKLMRVRRRTPPPTPKCYNLHQGFVMRRAVPHLHPQPLPPARSSFRPLMDGLRPACFPPSFQPIQRR